MDQLPGGLYDIVTKSGPLVLLLAGILWAGYKRYWVFGWQLDECQKREDEWKSLAVRNSGIADRAVNLAESKKT